MCRNACHYYFVDVNHPYCLFLADKGILGLLLILFVGAFLNDKCLNKKHQLKSRGLR